MWFAGSLKFLLFCGVLCVSLNHIDALGCRANGQYCQTHMDCCSGKCMTYTYFCAPVIHSNDDFNMIPPLFNEYWRYRRNIKPLEEQVEVVTLPLEEQVEVVTLPDDKSNTGNHAVERVDPITNSPPVGPTNKTCKAIGVDCSESSECCSNRCHTYLHRCVT